MSNRLGALAVASHQVVLVQGIPAGAVSLVHQAVSESSGREDYRI